MKKYVFNRIGDVIYSKRCQLGYSKMELSSISGVPYLSICRYESNNRLPKADSLIKIALALDLSFKDFVHSIQIEYDEAEAPMLKDGDRIYMCNCKKSCNTSSSCILNGGPCHNTIDPSYACDPGTFTEYGSTIFKQRLINGGNNE